MDFVNSWLRILVGSLIPLVVRRGGVIKDKISPGLHFEDQFFVTDLTDRLYSSVLFSCVLGLPASLCFYAWDWLAEYWRYDHPLTAPGRTILNHFRLSGDDCAARIPLRNICNDWEKVSGRKFIYLSTYHLLFLHVSAFLFEIRSQVLHFTCMHIIQFPAQVFQFSRTTLHIGQQLLQPIYLKL